jgi:hypothetical protein
MNRCLLPLVSGAAFLLGCDSDNRPFKPVGCSCDEIRLKVDLNCRKTLLGVYATIGVENCGDFDIEGPRSEFVQSNSDDASQYLVLRDGVGLPRTGTNHQYTREHRMRYIAFPKGLRKTFEWRLDNDRDFTVVGVYSIQYSSMITFGPRAKLCKIESSICELTIK